MTAALGHTGQPVLAICDEAMVPAAWLERDGTRLSIRTDGALHRLNLRAESLGGNRLPPLSARTDDLIRIAAYAYAVDQQISRGGDADPQRRHWRRELALCVPVAEPTFWQQPAVHAALTESLNVATDDNWRFSFSPATVRQLHFQTTVPVQPPHTDEPTAVILLSGGLDSLCATVAAVTAQGHRPVLVSHRAAPQHDHTQQHLVDELRRRFPGWSFPHMSFWIHQQGMEAVERTRRTRGFLVAALGLAVAGHLGVGEVLLADNGYVSINPPINAQLVGALSSRGTHPAFLRMVQQLSDHIFSGAIAITNPLATQTRAEALAVLGEHACRDLIPLTRSCARSRLPAATPHCGVCSQCVDRRFATVAAGLEEHDPVASYQTDVFTTSLPRPVPQLFARSYVGFAQRVATMDAATLFTELPELEACLNLDGVDVAREAEEVTGVMQRHAAEVVHALALQVGVHGEALYRGDLPADCLLRVAAMTPEARTVGSPQGVLIARSDEGTPAQVPLETLATAPPTTLQESPGTVSSSRWEHRGQHWLITFDGAEAIVRNLTGMTYLAWILKAAGREVLALDLVAQASPSSDFAPGMPAGEGANGDLRPAIDEQTRISVRARAKELEAARQEAIAVEDTAMQERIRDELESLTDYLRANTGRNGRPRRVVNEHERARQAVARAVKRAYTELGIGLPELREHLRASLRMGQRCCYQPQPPRHWEIVL